MQGSIPAGEDRLNYRADMLKTLTLFINELNRYCVAMFVSRYICCRANKNLIAIYFFFFTTKFCKPVLIIWYFKKNVLWLNNTENNHDKNNVKLKYPANK